MTKFFLSENAGPVKRLAVRFFDNKSKKFILRRFVDFFFVLAVIARPATRKTATVIINTINSSPPFFKVL